MNLYDEFTELTDAIDCGTADRVWVALQKCLVRRAAHESAIAAKLKEQAEDLLAQAAEHLKRADDFRHFDNALEATPITFSAQGMEAGTDETAKLAQPEGQQPGPKDAPE